MNKKMLSENLILTQGNGIGTRYLEHKAGIYIRLIEIDGFSSIMLELGTDTGWDELKEIIPDALKWNKFLNETQIHYQNFFLEMITEAHEKGTSYREIAKYINENVAKGLIDSRQNKYALVSVYSTLQQMRFSVEEIKNIIDEGTRNLENRQHPFDNIEYPVNRKKVISILEWWRNKTKNVQRPANRLDGFFTVQVQVKRRPSKGTEN